MRDIDVGSELGLHLKDPSLSAIFTLHLDLPSGRLENDVEDICFEIEVADGRTTKLGGGQLGLLYGKNDCGSGDHSFNRQLAIL